MAQNVKKLFSWIGLGILVGVLCGSIGAAFAHSVEIVTHIRQNNFWLIYLLPLGGCISAVLTDGLKVKGIGTNQIFESSNSNKKVSFLLAPAVFIGSVLSHLFGASAGREGAALQIGGSISAFVSKVFKLSEDKRKILILCGMAAFFSAIFGTPFAALIFALEVVVVGSLNLVAFFPVAISSFVGYIVASLLKVHPERFNILNFPENDIKTFITVLLIAIIGSFVSILFCESLHKCSDIFKKYLKNDYLKIALGGLAITVLTLIIGTTDYNGGGIDIINRIFESGEVKYEAFLFKILFTAITVAAGFKGGEIIPTLFVGATFGAVLGVILGVPLGFCAAVGMATLFVSVTNCPIATTFLCIEMFGQEGLVYYVLAIAIAVLLSGRCSLYSYQKVNKKI